MLVSSFFGKGGLKFRVLFFVLIFLAILIIYLMSNRKTIDSYDKLQLVAMQSLIFNRSEQKLNLDTKDNLSFDDIVYGNRIFNINSQDVMVFLHIQKTGGTVFGKSLVNDLMVKAPCHCSLHSKKCNCFRPGTTENWLFSRYSTGWKCGLHADWTELNSCVSEYYCTNYGAEQKRQYFYLTLLRDPVYRFLSEFKHVQRGATWKTAEHKCNGSTPTEKELPPCYQGDIWYVKNIDEFMNCKSNLAINRQTRMLADLRLVGCYNMSALLKHRRDNIILESAKKNLRAMAYFGLVEEQVKSQYMFEKTFQVKFRKEFEQFDINETFSAQLLTTLLDDELKRVEAVNYLDIDLYAYAKQLFFERYRLLRNYFDPNVKQVEYSVVND